MTDQASSPPRVPLSETGTALGSATASSSLRAGPGVREPLQKEQMADIYGVPCDVHALRTLRDGRQLGAGYDLREPSTWFVYDRESRTAQWHKHCGPYSQIEHAAEWIYNIREVR
jgi:hypothetical protein